MSPANQIAARAEGGVYVAFEDGTIRHVVRGEHQLVAGRHDEFCHGTASCGDGGQAKDALLRHVKGLAVGIDGSLYVADAGDHRVRRIGPGGHITTVAGTGEPCGGDHGRNCGDGELATSAKLAGPFGVWVDPIGRIYIADGDLGVREVRTDGKIVSVGAGAFDVRSVVGAASGDLFAATDRFLLRIDPKDKQVIKVAGTDTPGYNGNRTSRGTLAPGTAVQINHPAGLSIAANGDVLFADSGNHLVRAYVPDSGHVINALAGRVVDGTPRSGFNGDGHYALETELSDPLAVAALTNGEFVVADAGNSRVRTFGPGPR